MPFNVPLLLFLFIIYGIKYYGCTSGELWVYDSLLRFDLLGNGGNICSRKQAPVKTVYKYSYQLKKDLNSKLTTTRCVRHLTPYRTYTTETAESTSAGPYRKGKSSKKSHADPPDQLANSRTTHQPIITHACSTYEQLDYRVS